MKNQNRVWIHCRVSQQGEKCLLHFQENLLKNFAEALEMKVVGVTKEVSSGENFESFECKSMINSICRNRIDKVLCLTPKRICIYDDIFEEFEMLCNMNNVVVISVKEMQSLEHVLEFIS